MKGNGKEEVVRFSKKYDGICWEGWQGVQEPRPIDMSLYIQTKYLPKTSVPCVTAPLSLVAVQSLLDSFGKMLSKVAK
jgi:hypothetical protein